MLKREYDMWYTGVCNWLFTKFNEFVIAAKYGVVNAKSFDKQRLFLQLEVLDFVKRANHRRNPDQLIVLPNCISTDDFNRIVSNIKTTIL